MSAAHGEITKEQKIGVISLIILTGFICAIFFHYFQGMYKGLLYPYNTFLFDPTIKFTDFLGPIDVMRNLDPYWSCNGIYGCYPPFAYIIYYIFSLIPLTLSCTVFNGIFAVSFAVFIYKSLFSKSIFSIEKVNSLACFLTITFISYPFLFALDRANIEGLTFIFLAIFLFFYLKRKIIISSIFLVLAISIKIASAIFIILFLKDKKYKEAMVAIAATTIINLAGFSVLKGGMINNLFGFLHVLKNVCDISVLNANARINWSISFYWLKSILAGDVVEKSQLFLIAYIIFAFFVFAAVSFYVIRYEKKLWKNVALLTILMIVLPQVAYHYKLINLFLPLVLLINSRERSRYTLFYLVLFGLLLIPKNYPLFFCKTSTLNNINPILALLLMLVIIVDGTIDRLRRNDKNNRLYM